MERIRDHGVAVTILVCCFVFVQGGMEREFHSDGRSGSHQTTAVGSAAGEGDAAPWPPHSDYNLHNHPFIQRVDVDLDVLMGFFDQGTHDKGAMVLIRGALRRAGLCHPSTRTIVGGVHHGELTRVLVEGCNVTLDGFEISDESVSVAKENLEGQPFVTIHHMGLSNSDRDKVRVMSEWILESEDCMSESGCLNTLDADYHSGWSGTLEVAVWADREGIDRVAYFAMDCEGHEPLIIEGMHLELERNRRRFGAFQFELGSTWASKDRRRSTFRWDQYTLSEYLESHGYDLFMIGNMQYLPVYSQFMDCTHQDSFQHCLDLGNGTFVPGNVLALHRKFAFPAIRDAV